MVESDGIRILGIAVIHPRRYTSREVGDFVRYVCMRLLYEALFLAVLLPIGWLTLVLFGHAVREIPAVQVTFVLLALACIALTYFFSTNAARACVYQRAGFVGGLREAFADARLRLSFLPLVGRFFEPSGGDRR
jgi:hypothetical protein